MMWSSGYSLIDLSLDYLFNLLSTGLEHDPNAFAVHRDD